jgi:holo-[acyl-carrier protein] synthase
MSDPREVPVVGFDLVECDQVREALEAFGQSYLNRIYLPAEIAYAEGSPSQRVERLAARFAAKEAVFKALHWPAESPRNFHDIEVVRDAAGSCNIRLHGSVRVRAEATQFRVCSVSLTHVRHTAGAVVLALVAPG